MTGKPVKAIIFDMDGVLVNTEPHHVIIEKKLFARLNLNISDKEHSTYMGRATEIMWIDFVRTKGIPESVEELVEKHNQEIIKYFSELREIEVLPGIPDILEKLSSEKVPLAVASSSDAATIDIIMSRTGLRKYFLQVVHRGLVSKSKPAPDIFLYTAALLKSKPEECMVIEDSTHGIRAAKAANMLCIAYKGKANVNQDLSQADEFIENFSELEEVLKKYMVLS
jgi:HAD superfamily hydrolase (TIGR01509 family)